MFELIVSRNNFIRIKLITVLLLFSSLLHAQVEMDTTKIEFVTWENQQYAFIRNMKPNMIDAKCACDKLDMQLAKIETASENSFLQHKAFEKEGIEAVDGIQYWIGASDIEEEGKWIWIRDTSWFYDEKVQKPIQNAYENWGKTTLGVQPNNFYKNDEDEDCVVIRQDGFWYDIGCNKRLAYVICEK